MLPNEKLFAIYNNARLAGGNSHACRHEAGLRAVAEAAVQAEREGAVLASEAVAYLDLGVGGYIDIGSDLSDDDLSKLPKGRHILGIVGTYGVDGYVPAHPPQASATVPDGIPAWHVGWAVLAPNNNIRIWHKEKADAEASQRKYGGELVRLTTIAPAEPAEIPDGMKLVPEDPTDEMFEAAVDRAYHMTGRMPCGHHDLVSAIWVAMLAASQPDAAKEGK